MKQVLVRSGLVALGAVVIGWLLIELLERTFGPGHADSVVRTWTTAWWLGLVFGTWNVYSAVGDLQTALSGGRMTRWAIPAAQWLLRSEIFLTAACACMVAVGVLAIHQVGEPEHRALLILAGGLVVIATLVGDRLDRERVRQVALVPGQESPRAVAREASRLGRLLALDVRAKAPPVLASLESLIGRDHLSEEERAAIEESMGMLRALLVRSGALHLRLHEIDANYRLRRAGEEQA